MTHFFEPSPIDGQPVPAAQVPFMNECYLLTSNGQSDPTMVWGSEVDMSGLRRFLSERSLTGRVMLTPAHILLKAVGEALVRHPEFNRRILGKRRYAFNHVHVLMPLQRATGGAATYLIRDVDRKSYEDLARDMWELQKTVSRKDRPVEPHEGFFLRMPRFLAGRVLRTWMWVANNVHKPMTPLDQHLRGAPVVVNYLGFPGAPSLTAYKPSRFATDCATLNVTLGPATPRPVVVDGEVVVRPMAGLFVRADHRLVDARQLALFTGTLVKLLASPPAFDSDLPAAEAEAKPATADEGRPVSLSVGLTAR